MQKLQDSVFSLVKTTNLSPAVFSFLQPNDDFSDKTPLGGILKDTKHGWLALGPKFCVVNLRTGLKIAARTFGASLSSNTTVTSVVELPTPLSSHSQQLIISLQCDDIGMICVLHINGSQILRCIQTNVVVTELSVCDNITDGPFTCFNGLVIAGTRRGEIFVFDLNRACLIQALKDVSQGYEHLIRNELNPTDLSFLPLKAVHRLEEQRELALENDHHLGVLLNENSIVEGQYIFRNPDGTVRMKAKKDHVRVTVLQYIPQLGSVAVGYNFGAFQMWNLMTLDLEFTSQVNVECLPVTHFGFQEPCDDPRAFCYLWVVFSVIDRYEEEEFPLAVMYSLTYQGKRMLSDTKCLYQDFSTAAMRFQVELSMLEDLPLLGGKCISCHTYSIKTTLGDAGEDSMLNICQLVWECWGENANYPMQYGMLLFDLDQWYKDQMPSTYRLESNAFMSAMWCAELAGSGAVTLHVRLDPASVSSYSHATRLEEHFYPNSLQYSCICLNTSEACVLNTVGIQRQIISSMEATGPSALLNPTRLYSAALSCGLTPLYTDTLGNTQEDQRRYLLSVALEARLSRFLKRCAHDWATGTHSGVGCTLPFMVDWCWKRALELKENAKELTASLFVSSALPDRNVIRCLEHCVQQLTQLTSLMDAILTKCCNLIVPDALSEIEERHKGIGTVSLYFRVVQWLARVSLLPERAPATLPYPAHALADTYCARRMKLNRLRDNTSSDDNGANKSCSLLYIDQLIENEFGGDRTHQMWIKGGSECNGLYPPPSLYALLRLYLLPDIAEEHKHSLVLYLLVDYSMIYDDVRYEKVIRRLMQFPTMFGLSNTAIKATQAFWHLDHRDFDFALDQLQCLTGNTLSEWQHNVVLSSLLAQKKTQAALQYLHVRKPAPIQNIKDGNTSLNYSFKLNDHDKLEDWQSCCNLYLARGLVFEALDVIRMCVQNAGSLSDKTYALHFFFKGCRNTGNLAKILQVTLLPFEEEMFVKYLENCNESQTSDLLIMYYLQQARYLEAERYNNKLKVSKPRNKEMSTSMESLFEMADREGARDALVDIACAALPAIAGTVAETASQWKDLESHVHAPKPMSVYVQAKSPKNTYTYKSSFIHDTIENASETWMNRPKLRKGLKRALNIEETPFICTPKLMRSRSVYTEQLQTESTPPKRSRMDSNTAHTPMNKSTLNANLSAQIDSLLYMPDIQSPATRPYSGRPETPHSILKSKKNEREEADSPVDSRYLGDSDDELLETASNHTHYSDSTNKHLRFTIPPASESGSTSSPSTDHIDKRSQYEKETDKYNFVVPEKEMDASSDSFATTTSHPINENHPMESPPKKLATEANVARKSYKDTVRARRSLSISANSSLSDDPSTSIESIADIPITLINPRYSGEHKHKPNFNTTEQWAPESLQDKSLSESKDDVSQNSSARSVPQTPRARRSIRSTVGESTPLMNRSRSGTPERLDSPVVTPMRGKRITRSRSKTPELSPRLSPLAPILEQPKQESETEPHLERAALGVPTLISSRPKTPERLVSESPKLEVIKESPTKSSNTDSSTSSPTRRSLRSRSRTPEVEVAPELPKPSPRSLRSRSKTPEKLMSPKKDLSVKNKKSLSRIVLEANTFAKTKQTLESMETEIFESRSESVIECTPMKANQQVPIMMDVTLSPIVNKSVLQSSADSVLCETDDKDTKSVDKSSSNVGMKSLPAFATLHETHFDKSVLHSYQSSAADATESIQSEKETTTGDDSNVNLKTLPAFTTINETDINKSVLQSLESSVVETTEGSKEIQKEEQVPNTSKSLGSFMDITDFEKSVLRSRQSSIAELPEISHQEPSNANASSLITNDSDVEIKGNEEEAVQKEKEKIVEIEREINEIEDDMNYSERDIDSSAESDNSIESTDVNSIEDTEESTDVSDEDGETSEETPSGSEEDDSEENDVILIEDSESEADLPEKNMNKINKLRETVEVEVLTSSKQAPEVNVMTYSEQANNKESSEKAMEESNDPLNQAGISLMTDDNSAVEESDQSIRLNYTGENIEQDVSKIEDTKDSGDPEAKLEVEIQVTVNEKAPLEKDSSKFQPILLIDLPAFCEHVDAGAPHTKTKEPIIIQSKPKPIILANKKLDFEQMDAEHYQKDVKDTTTVIEKPKELIFQAVQKESVHLTMNLIEPQKESIKVTSTETIQTKVKQPSEITDSEYKEKEAKEPSKVTISKSQKVKETIPFTVNDADNIHTAEQPSKQPEEKSTKPAPRVQRRVKSTSSNKSSKDTHIETSQETGQSKKPKMDAPEATQTDQKESEEPKTPITRKRRQSNASKQSEEKTPEDITPSGRRPKTPTSAEMRKIITRRVSREMAEKLDESNRSVDELVLTPRRRTRRNKSIDDNDSVASESSVRSKVSEDAADLKPKKGKKPLVANKPELSVIPEAIVEDSSKEENSQNTLGEYSYIRRLTRHQKNMLESIVTSPAPAQQRKKRSTASRASQSSVNSEPEDEEQTSPFDVQPIDRMSLLNKTDFEGPPDTEEVQNVRNTSPESITSDASKMPRSRRALSETKSIYKAAKINRRVASVDVAANSDIGSPGPSGLDSPGRGRRVSFTKACEALHTPKGRRTSIDVKNMDSPLNSPSASEAEGVSTPTRRPRRASVQSNTSANKSETGKRSKKN